MRNLSIDYLKVLLAFFIILLHLNFLNDSYPKLNFILVNGLFRLAVPLYFIITGYYFFNINSSLKLKEWLKRISILYLFWMLFYFPLWGVYRSLTSIIINLIFGYFALWYLIAVLLAGSVLYYLRNTKFISLLVLSVVLYIVGYVTQQIGNLHLFNGKIDQILNIHIISRNFLFDALPLLSIGYLIKKYNIDKKIIISKLLIIISIVLVILESYINYIYISKTEPLDFLLTILFAAPIIFLYVKNIKIIGNNKFLAYFSTGLFLIHPFFIRVYDYFLLESKINKVFFVLITSCISSYILLRINNKIKYLL